MTSAQFIGETATEFHVAGAGPAVVLAGGMFQHRAIYGATGQLPADAQYRTLRGQTHMVAPAALAPVLPEFFTR